MIICLKSVLIVFLSTLWVICFVPEYR
jgi:hypothetical protein